MQRARADATPLDAGPVADGKTVMDILLIDDEDSLRRSLRITLETMGHTSAEAESGEQALRLLQQQRFDAAFLDLRLGRESGLDLLPRLLREAPDLAVVIITAYATIASSVEAMRYGAFDYLPKPFTPDQVRVTLERWRQMRRLRNQVADLLEQVRAAAPEPDLYTVEQVMRQALDRAFQAAAGEATVLLCGESGTGKGVLARAMHARSPRAAGPFVALHCPSLPAEALESELFGHARGAAQDSAGKVAAADSGTLFLDEVGGLPLSVQSKLWRLVQEKTYERVGDTRGRAADVRIMAATNRDLAAEAAAGRFREDLAARLRETEIDLPPLRRRRADIVPLAERLLRFFARQTGKSAAFDQAAQAALTGYDWPGNIRELRAVVERALLLAPGGELGVAHLSAPIGALPAPRFEAGSAVTLEALEAEHIRRVLAGAASSIDAAAVLGIDPSTLYRKRKRYGF
jgi:NtrC-family two-component system response regulator AlgB